MSPSPFVVEWVSRAARERQGRGRALDVAMGRGRHALALARAGFATFGVDVDSASVRDARDGAAAHNLRLLAFCADLTTYPLPRSWFDVIVVTRYLQRDLFASVRAAAAPRGVVLYETFTTAQRALGRGPRSTEHLLESGELRAYFDVPGWGVVHYEETQEPEALARIVAERM